MDIEVLADLLYLARWYSEVYDDEEAIRLAYQHLGMEAPA